MLRGGGAFIFSVPAHPWLFGPHDAALFHRRRYVERGLRQLMGGTGLQIEALIILEQHPVSIYCAHRLWGQFRRTQSAHSDLHAPPRVANEVLAGLLAIEAASCAGFAFPGDSRWSGSRFGPDCTLPCWGARRVQQVPAEPLTNRDPIGGPRVRPIRALQHDGERVAVPHPPVAVPASSCASDDWRLSSMSEMFHFSSSRRQPGVKRLISEYSRKRSSPKKSVRRL